MTLLNPIMRGVSVSLALGASITIIYAYFMPGRFVTIYIDAFGEGTFEFIVAVLYIALLPLWIKKGNTNPTSSSS